MLPLSFYTILSADFNRNNSILFPPKFITPPFANIQHMLLHMCQLPFSLKVCNCVI